MIALSPRENVEYVLREDRGGKAPTTFVLRPLTKQQVIEIEDIMSAREPGKGVPFGSYTFAVLKAGLAGWRNLRDAKGEEVVFTTDGMGQVDDDLLLRFTIAQRGELADAIFGMANLTDEEAKN